jgi:hypothetical protein
LKATTWMPARSKSEARAQAIKGGRRYDFGTRLADAPIQQRGHAMAGGLFDLRIPIRYRRGGFADASRVGNRAGALHEKGHTGMGFAACSKTASRTRGSTAQSSAPDTVLRRPLATSGDTAAQATRARTSGWRTSCIRITLRSAWRTRRPGPAHPSRPTRPRRFSPGPRVHRIGHDRFLTAGLQQALRAHLFRKP